MLKQSNRHLRAETASSLFHPLWIAVTIQYEFITMTAKSGILTTQILAKDLLLFDGFELSGQVALRCLCIFVVCILCGLGEC